MKRILILFTALIALNISAQNKFGYTSYQELLSSLPEYSTMVKHINELQAAYDEEIKRADREFNKKYADFIDNQASFPKNILVKRHKELQELMEKSMAFKEEVRDTMNKAREEMVAPLKEKIRQAVSNVCMSGDYLYIIDKDDNKYIAINPNYGIDVTAAVLEELKKQK